jgi:hypothetical protein
MSSSTPTLSVRVYNVPANVGIIYFPIHHPHKKPGLSYLDKGFYGPPRPIYHTLIRVDNFIHPPGSICMRGQTLFVHELRDNVSNETSCSTLDELGCSDMDASTSNKKPRLQ